MNETREELLNGLTYVQDMLVKMQNTLTRYIALEREFRAKQEEIGTSSIKDKTKLLVFAISGTIALFLLLISVLTHEYQTFLVFAVAAVFAAVQRNKKSKLRLAALVVMAFIVVDSIYRLYSSMKPGLAIILIVLAAIAVGAEYLIITRTNRIVAARNKRVEENNRQVQEQRVNIYNHYVNLQKELSASTSSWFPPDYYNMEAVEFFITAVRNYRANNVKEMVNLFEATAQHKEMIAYQKLQTQQLNQLIAGQQAIKGQLRFANMMNVANFIQLSGINAGVKDLNSQVGQMRGEVRNRLDDIAGSLRRR